MGASCAPPPLDQHDGNREADDFKDFVPEKNYIKDISSIFKLGKILGSGVSCSVYVGKMHSSSKRYAVKEMKRDDEFNPRSFRQEVDFLTSLSPHDHILKYVDAYVTPINFYIVTELCTGGALFGMNLLNSIYIVRTILMCIYQSYRYHIVYTISYIHMPSIYVLYIDWNTRYIYPHSFHVHD